MDELEEKTEKKPIEMVLSVLFPLFLVENFVFIADFEKDYFALPVPLHR